MKRNMGIIIILVGVGILFISIFFSSGYHTGLNFIGNISQMEIVIDEGKYPETPVVEEPVVEEEAPPVVEEEAVIEEVRERVAIPLKYPLSLSVVLILLGTGIILISKNKETNA
jgi:hypothetical protein